MVAKPHILHIITSLKIGGAESLLVDFLGHKNMNNVDHSVIYFHDGPNRKLLEQQGVPCFTVKRIITYDMFFFFNLYTLVKKLKPDCIHSWLWSANIAARLIGAALKIPVLNSFHLGVNLDGRFRNIIDSLTISLPQKLVAVSDGVARTIETTLSIPASQIKIIKNGIDGNALQAQALRMPQTRHALGLDENHFIIGSVGRWIPRKNYHFLLEVFAEFCQIHKHARLILLGKGPEKKALQEKAQSLKIMNEVLFIEGQRALPFYSLFDCFIQVSFKEGLSIALLEAMSFSVPTIIVQDGINHEVISHKKNGFIIDTYDIKKVVPILEHILYNQESSHFLGQKGLRDVQDNFSLTQMIKAYQDEYCQLVNKRFDNV